MTITDHIVAWLANYLLWVMVAVAVGYWLFGEDASGKKKLAASGIIGLVLTVLLLVIAGALHTDPRPFVVNPALQPLIKHSADNGFPSDHAAAAGLIATLILTRNRLVGLILAACALVVAATRVAAHVHHVQDVIGGLLIGVVAALLAVWIVNQAIKLRTSRASGEL